MTEEFDATTIRLNELVKENFKRLEKEQSTPEGLAARQQRRDEWYRENSIYTGQRRNFWKDEPKKYKGTIL